MVKEMELFLGASRWVPRYIPMRPSSYHMFTDWLDACLQNPKLRRNRFPGHFAFHEPVSD